MLVFAELWWVNVCYTLLLLMCFGGGCFGFCSCEFAVVFVVYCVDFVCLRLMGLLVRCYGLFGIPWVALI